MTERYTEWLALLSNRDWALTNLAAIAFVLVLVWNVTGIFPTSARRLAQRLMVGGAVVGLALGITLTLGGNGMDILFWIGVGCLVGGVVLLVTQPETRRAIVRKLTGKE